MPPLEGSGRLARLEFERLDWFALEDDGAYRRLEPGGEGLLRSRAFPGLHLAAEALLARDLAVVLKAVRAAADADAHATFVRKLQATRQG